ncbi:MAG: YjbH domain-containing protein [Rhodobacteraceae bacterium]|nr:YjbH domain-containing protein [Paracoccaceae bacterium]
MDMPSAEHRADGAFSVSVSSFGGISRYNLTFQAFPWLSATFRYSGAQDLNLFGFDTYYDRGFDVRFRLLEERDWIPHVTLGFQDFVGTGVYSAEYLVATKTFATPDWSSPRPGQLKVTAGLGWGRFGSAGSIGSVFDEDRPVFDGGTGGELATDTWFRGPVSPFAGIEYMPNDRWSFKVEYSTDAYTLETEDSNVFDPASQINFGVEYQWTPTTRIGAYYMYGTEIGVSAQFQLSPYRPLTPLRLPAPQSVPVRPNRSTNPDAWTTSWASSERVRQTVSTTLGTVLRKDGLVLDSLVIDANTAEVRYRNLRYASETNAVGRVARAMALVLPPSVETFRIVPTAAGLKLSAITIRRSDLEAVEFAPDSSETLEALMGYGDAAIAIQGDTVVNEALYPGFSWSLEPFFSRSYFDPDLPFRLDVGAQLAARYEPAPGWIVAGALRYRIAGNVADGRLSNSQLERVRSNQTLYAQEDFTMNRLFAARQWRPAPDIYARVTGGYLESMFGGISTEVLWKPVTSPLGLGLDLNYVKQRDFDQRFGFQDYDVVTGHASAYYEFGRGYIGQLDVGRYLAGDVGATFSMDRTFDNGWSLGAFFTLTDVSAEEFGEGSFDKGLRFRIPIGWFIGEPNRQAIGTTIRPVQRDGGQRLRVPGRIYSQVRDAHRNALQGQSARVWE